MPQNRERGADGHPTTVVLQPDIYRRALEQGIDISDACNQALAALTGSRYIRQNQAGDPAPRPVIIAKDGAVPPGHDGQQKTPGAKLHPVINADDPAAPATVVRAKTVTKNIPAVVPAPALPHEPEHVQEMPVAAPALHDRKAGSAKGRETSRKKQPRGEALRSFFSAKITRTGDPEDCVGKDELYTHFTRFCRDRRIAPVPERRAVTVALKNQFALTEKTGDGTPAWTGIRLK